MPYPSLPEKVTRSIELLKEKPITDPEAFRKWWDAQVDSLLDEFNLAETPRYDDWNKYLKNFSAAVSEAVPDNANVNKLFALTFNQLGRIDVDRAARSLEIASAKVDKKEEEIDEKYVTYKLAVTTAKNLIKNKWRFNSNLTITENTQLYASQYQLLPSYEYKQNGNVDGYLSRALDRAEHFLGSQDEYFRILPLTDKDYQEFIEYETKIPSLYNKLSEQLTDEQRTQIKTTSAGTELKTIELRTAIETGFIQEMIMGMDLDLEDNELICEIIKRLDPDNLFTAWWSKTQEKIEKMFSLISVPMLKKLLPEEELNDATLIEYENHLRITYYSLIREMEVFDERILRDRWSIDKSDSHLNGMILYKQTLTKNLRKQENPYALKNRKADFIARLNKYELRVSTLSGVSSGEGYVLREKSTKETELGKIRGQADKERTYSVELLDAVLKISEDSATQSNEFFKLVGNKIDASNLSAENKLDFLSFLIKAREETFFDSTLFKEKRHVIGIGIKIKNWLVKNSEADFKSLEMKELDPQFVLDAIKANTDPKKQKELLNACVVSITGGNPTYKPISEKVDMFLKALDAAVKELSVQDTDSVEKTFAKAIEEMPDGLKKYFDSSKNNLGNKSIKTQAAFIEIIRKNKDMLVDVIKQPGTPVERAQRLKEAVNKLDIHVFFKKALVGYLTPSLNLCSAYIDAKEFLPYRDYFSKPSDFLADAIFDFFETNKGSMPLYQFSQFGFGLGSLFADWQDNSFSTEACNKIFMHQDISELKEKLISFISAIKLKENTPHSNEKELFLNWFETNYMGEGDPEKRQRNKSFSITMRDKLKLENVRQTFSARGLRQTFSKKSKATDFETMDSRRGMGSSAFMPEGFPKFEMPSRHETIEDFLYLYENLEREEHPIVKVIKTFIDPLLAAINTIDQAVLDNLITLKSHLERVRSIDKMDVQDDIFTFLLTFKEQLASKDINISVVLAFSTHKNMSGALPPTPPPKREDSHTPNSADSATSNDSENSCAHRGNDDGIPQPPGARKSFSYDGGSD
jgi:organic radical activating enzyme